jgi:gluconate kinase
MPPSLLDSQLATLEPPGSDEAIRIEAVGTPADTARAVVDALEGG